MKVYDVYKKINSWAPYSLACDWDNSGLTAGREDAEVRGILVALDFTEEVLIEAKSLKVNLIVTHHPFIFSGMKSVTDKDTKGRLILSLIESGIALMCAHTNMDTAKGGINDVLCEMSGLQDVIHLGNAGEDESGNTVGEIRMGTYRRPLSDFIKGVKSALNCSNIRCSISDDKILNKVAVCSGSGCSYIDLAVKSGADALLTADAKYHDFQEASDSGLILIDAGHFETENIICQKIADYLSECKNVYVSKSHKGFYNNF